MDAAATERLEQYFERIGTHLKDRRKRESFAIYAFGILGDTDRKSVEPIAAAACGDPARTVHMHDKLLHFVGQSRWSDEAVRLEASRYVIDVLAARSFCSCDRETHGERYSPELPVICRSSCSPVQGFQTVGV